MASRNAQLADAVVSALNAGTFSQSFTAVRRYVPLTDMSALSTLTVTVISAGEKNERETKDADAPTISVAIGIEKLINSPDPSSASANSEVDALMLLVEQINDFFGPDTISLTNGMFVESEIVVLYDVNALLTENVFRGVVKVYYAVGPDPIP